MHHSLKDAIIILVPLTMPKSQTCSREIYPKTTQNRMLISCKILLNMPRLKNSDFVKQKITKMVQWFDRFLSTCQTHKHAAETFVLKAHETVWCSHWKYYWACPRRKALTWQHKKNQNGAIVPLVPFTMPNPQTCSWDICPKTPLHSMVFALNIIQSVPRVIKWTQAWPWHARLCDHNETAILAHSHTIRKAQSLYQDLCLLAYWVIH